MAAGAEMLDAPASGGDKGAIAGTLSIMVGGEAATFERALPILQGMGKTIVHGVPRAPGRSSSAEPGRRRRGAATGAVYESSTRVLGLQGGVDPASGLSCCKAALPRQGPRCEGTCSPARSSPGFRIRLHLKDLKNALELAREIGVPLPRSRSRSSS